MKSIYFLLLLCSLYISTINAQEAIHYGNFTNTQVIVQDSVILISTLGAPYESSVLQNGTLVTSAPLIIQITEDTTSIHSIPPIVGLKVFPNPTTDLLVMERATADEELNIELYSTDGKHLFRMIWPSGINSIQISLQSYAQGIYQLNISDKKHTKGSRYTIMKK